MSKEAYQLFLSHNFCRCCGMEKGSGIDLQDSTNDRATKLIKILGLLPKKVINIKAADKLTTFVCVDCEMTLHHFNQFCEMIKKVQKDLKSQMKPTVTEKNIPEKPQKKIDCHLNGVSSDGSPIVISVGGDGKIKCEDCQCTLVISELITLDIMTHGLGSVFCVCKHCGHRDDIGNFLQNDSNSVKCPQCVFVNYENRDGASLVANDKAKKSINGGITCEVCNRRFRTTYKYNRHKLIHIGVKPFLCETCGMKFNQKTGLKLHVMKHAKTNPHSCQWCGQSFRFKVSLQSHIINIHGTISDNTTIYECDQCHKQFATGYKLRRHYRLHTGDRPYECTICNKFFSQTGNLKNHMKKHKSDNTFPEPFSTDPLSDQILDTILDSCPQGKEFINLKQQGEQTFGLVDSGNVDKHNATDLFSDFNPQDVLFDNTAILPSPTPDTSIILPNFSSLQGGTEINL